MIRKSQEVNRTENSIKEIRSNHLVRDQSDD